MSCAKYEVHLYGVKSKFAMLTCLFWGIIMLYCTDFALLWSSVGKQHGRDTQHSQ